MSTTWILIANASQAHIYVAQKARLLRANGHDEENLTLIKSLSHGESREKTENLVSDRNGSYRSGPSGHGSFVESSEPKEIEADRFAKELVAELDSGRVNGDYDELIMVANPHFQGLLNKNLSEQLMRLVANKIDKDYTKLTGRTLVSQLREHL